MKKLSITEEEIKQSLDLIYDDTLATLCDHLCDATVWSLPESQYENAAKPLHDLLDTIWTAVIDEKWQRKTRPSNNTEERES